MGGCRCVMFCLNPLQRISAPPVQHTKSTVEEEPSPDTPVPDEETETDKEGKLDGEELPMETQPAGEFDNLLGNDDDVKRGHNPTIPAEVMKEIEEDKEESPEMDDNNEGGVASSDEEVVS